MNPKLPAPLLGLPDDYAYYVIGGLVAVGAFVLFVLIRLITDARARRLQARMAMIRSPDDVATLRRRQPQGAIEEFDDSFANLLKQTGLDLTPDRGIAWMIFVGCLVGVAVYLLTGLAWLTVIGLSLGAAGVFAVFLAYRTTYRIRLQDQLPDGIALMARALRSGLSLEQAVSLVAHEGAAPLASEFQKCEAQIKLGLPVHTALESMARQLNSVDVNALVSTIAVAQTTGGNLPLLLDRLAASARDRANFRAYFRAATALARISVIPVALTVPVLVVIYFLWTPSYAQPFMASPNAPLVIGAAMVVECIGLYWIYRLLRFDY
jgi:tight adherence protein B